jgi:hypothetical protein
MAARTATSPRALTGNTSALNSPRASDLDVRPADPTRMLGVVLLLAVVTIIVVLLLVWWLT